MRFYPINSGAILLDGRSIYDYSRASLRQQFGMVLQETWLKQGTIHDNISFGNPKASREQVIAAAKAANADFSSNSCHRDTIPSWKMQENLSLSVKPSF